MEKSIRLPLLPFAVAFFFVFLSFVVAVYRSAVAFLVVVFLFLIAVFPLFVIDVTALSTIVFFVVFAFCR
jgi:hypothetical protein